MRKWVVKRKTLPTGFPTWLAFNAYGHEFRYCPTWREAMDYADHMTRTIEVTLPRTHTLPTGRHTVQKNGLVVEYARSRSQSQLPPSCIVIEPWERRPLALALLTLDEKEKQCGK